MERTQQRRVKKLQLVLLSGVVAVCAIIAANWHKIAVGVLGRPITPTELERLRSDQHQGLFAPPTPIETPRIQARVQRWSDQTTPIGTWIEWYGESDVLRERTQYSLTGEHLGSTWWLPTGTIHAQLTADQKLHTAPPWPLSDRDQHRSTHDLRGVLLESYTLRRIDLKSWNGERARITGATISSIDFSEASMQHADFTRTQVSDCVFDQANLSRATLAHASIEACAFLSTNLNSASLNGARIVSCDFSRATLLNLQWQGASLTNCSFHDADLQGANFQGCTLEGVDLSRARNISPEQLSGATLIGEVTLPTSFPRSTKPRTQ